MPSPPESGSPEEALRRLEQRLDRASEAAERLMAQAAAEAAARATEAVIAGAGADARAGAAIRAARTIRAGAGDPGGAGDPARRGRSRHLTTARRLADPRATTPPHPLPDLDPLVALVQAMRDLIPPELQHRLIAALRELLLALRALIDWYLERLERRREQGVEVQDIPIL